MSLLLPTSVFATNGYQLIGIGAYQKGLAGAVTANPGSAMTAISNPAGMATIGRRADFSLEMFMPDRTTDFTAAGGESVNSDAKQYGIPALGWTAPVGDNNPDMYFGGGAYGTSGLGVDYAQTLAFPAAASPIGTDMYFDGYSAISFFQMAPTLAWKQNDKLSIGVTLNIDSQTASFKQRMMADLDNDGEVNDVVEQLDLSKSASAFGFGFAAGILFDVNKNFTLGASYKSKQLFSDLEYNLAQGDVTLQGTQFPAGKYKVELDYPQQFAAGLAFSQSKGFSVSADVKWINWKDTLDELKIKGPGGDFALATSWDDQIVFALGVNWGVTPTVNLRAGFNYADAPIEDKDVDNNLILPAVVTTHYTLGGDYAFNKNWQLGAHFMYVPKESLKSPNSQIEINMEQTSFGLNIGYIFN
jgi:long-chain fatty acid transport protein